VANSVLRVLSDAQGGLAHLNLQHIDWLSLQLLADTAETEWLDRHGFIWLVNADHTLGRKTATLAEGIVTFTGIAGTVVPENSRLAGGNGVEYETIEEVTIGGGPSEADVRAIDPGAASNQLPGAVLSLITAIPGADPGATVLVMTGGADEESDDLLRVRVLERIRNPPHGGDAMDYVLWTKAVAGVSRAWAAPLEMGVGTVTVRFMADDLRAATAGFPLPQDIEAVRAYLDIQRPVAVKDFFVESPIPEPIDFTIEGLEDDNNSTRGAIQASVEEMLHERAAPAFSMDGVRQEAQTIYAAWVSEAILQSAGVRHFHLIMDDHVMPNAGCLAVLGAITYV